MEKFNGWKNWETWNVALWISNDTWLNNLAKKFKSYSNFAEFLIYDFDYDGTRDNVAWDLPCLDIAALDRVIADIK